MVTYSAHERNNTLIFNDPANNLLTHGLVGVQPARRAVNERSIAGEHALSIGVRIGN